MHSGVILYFKYTDQNYKHNTCFCPHFSWAELKDLRLFLCTQKAYFSQILFTNLSKSVLVSTHLHARRPHRGLDLTAVRRHNRLEWANAHIRWRLALWRGVLFTDESRFLLYRVDGRQRVWRPVGERFSDVNVVDRVPWWRWGYGLGRCMLWTTNTGAFYWWHF